MSFIFIIKLKNISRLPSPGCSTVNGILCALPFKYSSTSHTSCTDEGCASFGSGCFSGGNNGWCATNVDDSGVYSTWGYCSSLSCPQNEYLMIRFSSKLGLKVNTYIKLLMVLFSAFLTIYALQRYELQVYRLLVIRITCLENMK